MSLTPLLIFVTRLTSLAELPGEALGTATPSRYTLPLAVAVRHLTLVVAQLALLALEARVALALPGHVVAMAGTEDWTQHWKGNAKHGENNATQNTMDTEDSVKLTQRIQPKREKHGEANGTPSTKEDTKGPQVMAGKIIP